MRETDEDLDRVLRALSHPVRREILWLVWEQARPVGDIAARFPIAGPTISEHLRVLRDADLVTVERQGTLRRYRARHERLGPLVDLIAPDRVTRAEERTGGDGTATPPAAPWRAHVVTAEISLAASVEDVFSHWTSPPLMALWAGDDPTCDPVDGGVFAFTLDWGGVVRGVYEAVVAPRLLVFRWDFDQDRIPIPSSALGPTFVLLSPTAGGTRLDVTQLVRSPEAAHFLAAAWPDSLQRLHAAITHPDEDPS